MSKKASNKNSIIQRLADNDDISVELCLQSLKETLFSGVKYEDISNAQLFVLVKTCETLGLDPHSGCVKAFPKGKGIEPMVGVDGWSQIINRHPENDGMTFTYSDRWVESEIKEHRPCPEWIECTVYLKNRAHPVVVTEFFDECYQEPKDSKYNKGEKYDGPWQNYPKRMLRHRAMIQAARVAFGLGVPSLFDDRDEEERVAPDVDGQLEDLKSKLDAARGVLPPAPIEEAEISEANL